jgi:hypothetical protein
MHISSSPVGNDSGSIAMIIVRTITTCCVFLFDAFFRWSVLDSLPMQLTYLALVWLSTVITRGALYIHTNIKSLLHIHTNIKTL